MPEEQERDLIDDLIDVLNEGTEGVVFDRDVLDTNRPEDWAAVELTGSVGEWADGILIDQALTADIWVCVSSRGTRVRTEVQNALQAFQSAGHDIGWSLKERNYLYDLNKVMWHWTVTLWGPIEIADEELPFTDPEEDPDEDPEWDPEEDPEEDPETEPEEDPEEDPETEPEEDPEEDEDGEDGRERG